MFDSQSLQILLAGKSEVLSDDNMLSQAKNRGGLWTVTTDVFQIFCNVEDYFRKSTVVISKKIDVFYVFYVITISYVIKFLKKLSRK